MKEQMKGNIASAIDHTLLKATATKEQILQYCEEGKKYHFASVCVNPCYTKLVSTALKGSGIKTAVVIGFPLGANTSQVKAFEAQRAVEDGADELDMVINIGALKEGNLRYVEEDIRGVVKAAKGAAVKVIIETCYLNNREKQLACHIAQSAGAHFVKTSTGFGTGGATVEDVALMKEAVGDNMQVKASGGIRTLEQAKAMIEAGADRIGTGSAMAIIDELI